MLQPTIMIQNGVEQVNAAADTAKPAADAAADALNAVAPAAAEGTRSWFSWLTDQESWFNAPIAQTGLSLATLVQLAAVLFIVVVVMKTVRSFLSDRLLSRTKMDIGARDAVARIASYVVGLIGLLVGLPIAGINLSTLNVLVGALGVGIGFGLQNIVNNFVSGLIILIERPIQIGQRVEISGTTGRIDRIGARSTTVITNDNIATVLPNSKFIEEPVINWSFGGDRRVRFRLPVGVSYGSDPHQVKEILLGVAKANEHVLQHPEPSVIFKAFGDSSLDFELWVWTETMSERPNVFKSPLYFAIWDAFAEHGIEIPFPQRDLHVKGEVAIRRE